MNERSSSSLSTLNTMNADIDGDKMDDEKELGVIEKKVLELERRFNAGEITEEEAEASLMQIAEEMGEAFEEFLMSMMGALMEGMTEVMGSMFKPMWSEQIPSEDEVLSIAKKYFDEHKKHIPKNAAKEFSKYVGKVRFDGLLYDTPQADDLIEKAFATGGNCSLAVAYAAAAVGWGSGYEYGSDALARILEDAEFIEDEDRKRDAEKLSRFAVSLNYSDADLYVTLARILYKKGDTDGALDALREGLGYQPDHEAALKFKEEILKGR